MYYLFKRSTFVGSAWSFGFFIPATTANDLRLRRIFYPRFYPLHLFSYINSWERASIFPFECSVLNKGTTGTIFITSLVWRGLCHNLNKKNVKNTIWLLLVGVISVGIKWTFSPNYVSKLRFLLSVDNIKAELSIDSLCFCC